MGLTSKVWLVVAALKSGGGADLPPWPLWPPISISVEIYKVKDPW